MGKLSEEKKLTKLTKPIVSDSIYEKLYFHFKNSQDELLYILGEIHIAGEYKSNELIEHLDHENRVFQGRKEVRTEGKKAGTLRTYYQWVAVFHYVYDVPIHVFNLPKKDPVRRYYENRPRNNFKLVHLENLEKKDLLHQHKKAIKRDYLEPTEDLINNLNNRLHIYDYLERYEFLQESSSEDEYEKKNTLYIDIHKTIYEEIQAKVLPKKNNIEYIRLLSLPLRYKKIQDFEQINSKVFSKEEVRLMQKEIIRFTSVSLFEHICECLIKRPDYQNLSDGSSSENRSGFYLVYPFRAASYALIDNCDWFLTEYYKFEQGTCRLDMMYVEKAGSQNRDRAKIYSREITNIVKSKNSNPKFSIEGSAKLVLELIIEQKVRLGLWSSSTLEMTKLDNYSEDETKLILDNEKEIHQIERLIKKYNSAIKAEDSLFNRNLNS